MLLIIEKQPVQYRAPLYAEIERRHLGAIQVIYQSSGAVTQTTDKEFGDSFSWDIPLLEGYSYEILEHPRKRLTHLWKKLNQRSIDGILLTDFDSRISQIALICSVLLGKPLWLRMETQDEAFQRSELKSTIRSHLYQLIYSVFSRALFIGKLNRQHYENHGFSPHQLFRVPYIVSNPTGELSIPDKQQKREQIRKKYNISSSAKVVSFFGKLIPKKNPGLILDAFGHLSSSERNQIHFLFVGSGELEPALKKQAEQIGCHATFAGFVNQSKIHDYYLSSDIMCLPSRQMGETWGLTVNEGLQTGSSIICSQHVGSSKEFGEWERVRVCNSEDAAHFSECLRDLLKFEPNFSWCLQRMKKNYSMESAATDYIKAISNAGFANPNKTWLSV